MPSWLKTYHNHEAEADLLPGKSPSGISAWMTRDGSRLTKPQYAMGRLHLSSSGSLFSKQVRYVRRNNQNKKNDSSCNDPSR